MKKNLIKPFVSTIISIIQSDSLMKQQITGLLDMTVLMAMIKK